MSHPKKIVIVGNCAAGIGALEAFRSCDQESTVTIVSDENRRLYSRCLLSYFLDGSIDESGLTFRSDDALNELKATFVLGKKVICVSPESQQIICDDDTRFNYDKLLIATGGRPKIPENIAREIEGVFVLRTMNDAFSIRNKMKSAKNGVVLGGGLVGLKVASALNKAGLHVTVVVRSSHVLSQMIDYDAAQIVISKLQEKGIQVWTAADVINVDSEKKILTGVKVVVETDKQSVITEKVLPCDILIVAKGVHANMDLIQETRIERDWGIVTDAAMQTNIKNIFAAGDVAETYDMAIEERSVNALWTCAIQQGRVAGYNMAGQARQYDGSLGMNSIQFPGIDLISFGVIKPKPDSGYEVMVDNRSDVGVYKKIVLKEDKIKGLILVNKIDNAGILLSLLSRKVNIADFKEEILSDRFNYARLLSYRVHDEMVRYLSATKSVGSDSYG